RSTGPTMKYDYFSADSNCSWICVGIHYSSPSVLSIELCAFFFGVSPAALKRGPERNCGVDLTSSFSFALCVLILFSISGNSKLGQDRSEWQAALNRHGFQRICKFRAAVTAHLICLAFQREHTAEVNVVTPKKGIK